MNKRISLIILVTLIFANSKEGDIDFQYGFLSKPSYDSDSLTMLSDSAVIYTGDLLRINLGYKNKTHFCIVYRDATGKYQNLYSQDDSEESNQDTLYVPSALRWTAIAKPTGIETFYFINSTEVLSDLVAMLVRYDTAPAKGKEILSIRIQDEINSYDPDVQDELSSISSELDRPVTGGVAFRGDDDGEIKDLHLTHECSGSGGVAFKKIVLIHQPKR